MKKALSLLAFSAITMMISCTKIDLKSAFGKTTSSSTPTHDTVSILQNFAYGDQTTPSGVTHFKIGSYVIKNLSPETVTLTGITVGTSVTTISEIRNVSATINSAVTGAMLPSISAAHPGTFATGSATLAPNASDTISVYADIMSDSTASFRTNMIVWWNGSDGITKGTHNNASYSGQAIYLASSPLSCSLTATTLPMLSSAPQYIAAGTTTGVTNASQVTYNIAAPSGATITELTFSVGDPRSVTAVQVGSVTAPVVSGTAHLTGLSLSVPSGPTGLNVTAYISYPPVGPSGPIPSGTLSRTDLNSIKYICVETGEAVTTTVDALGPTMKVMASKPILSVTPPIAVLTTGFVEAIDVNVAADMHGALTLITLPLQTSTVNATLLGAADSVVVKDIYGVRIPASNTTFMGGYTVITLTPNVAIPAGTTKTFKIYLPVTYVGTPGGTAHLYTQLSPGAGPVGFEWIDSDAGVTTPEGGGAWIPSFPTAMSDVHN